MPAIRAAATAKVLRVMDMGVRFSIEWKVKGSPVLSRRRSAMVRFVACDFFPG